MKLEQGWTKLKRAKLEKGLNQIDRGKFDEDWTKLNAANPKRTAPN